MVASKRIHDEHVAKIQRENFDPPGIHGREKELNELSELRSYFVSASSVKPYMPHPSLRKISAEGKAKKKGNSLIEFLLRPFSS
jgi:hypothetical protein